MIVKLRDIAQVIVALPQQYKKEENKTPNRWIKPGDLFSDNKIDVAAYVDRLTADIEWAVKKGDIIIKRISPSFITFIADDMPNIFCSNNLIIIRASAIVNKKYVACCLSQKILEFAERTSVGSVMPTISKKDLEEIEVNIFSEEKQEAIGNLWWQSIERSCLYARLVELEKIRTSYILNKLLDNQGDK